MNRPPSAAPKAKATSATSDERRDDRKAGRTRDGESEEDDVARHVGHEHVPQNEVAEGVNETGHHC